MEGLGISSPWARHARMIEALFDGDDSVVVDYDDAGPKVTIYVDGQGKADAIAAIVPQEVEFGNVTLSIDVIPSNDGPTIEDAFMCAFSGNPAFSGVVSGGFPAKDVTYVMFVPKCVQFFDDDISDVHGVCTMTYEQVAEKVLKGTGAMICSDLLGDTY